MNFSRRGFIGRVAAALGALVLGKPISARPAQESYIYIEDKEITEAKDIFESKYDTSLEQSIQWNDICADSEFASYFDPATKQETRR